MSRVSGERSRPTRWIDSRENVAVLVVGLIAAVVFLPSLAGSFIFDDVWLIGRNEFIHEWRWLPRAFTTHFWDVSQVADEGLQGAAESSRRYYRPLVTLSYLTTWMIAGAKPWTFHLGNVMLHGATAGLVVRAARRWTGSLRLAVGIALLFAIHPTRTENVTWISGRTDVQMLFFLLLALEGFAAFERRRATGSKGAAVRLCAGLLAMTAAVLSKEPAALLPLLVLAEPRAEGANRGRRRWLVLAITGMLCGAYLLGRALFWSPEGETVRRVLTPWHALMTVGLYAERAVFPWPPTMYYAALERGPDGPLYPAPLLALGIVVLVAGGIALVVAWRRSRTAFWLLLAAGAFMGPLLNVYFTGLNVSAQDRFLYAPLLFATAALVILFRESLVPFTRRRAVVIAVAGACLACIFMIEIRTLDFRDEQTFWEAELEHNPDHPYVLAMLGRTAATRGDLAEAYAFYSRAELPSSRKYALANDTAAHFQRAAILAALLPDGRVDELAALADELWRMIEPNKVPRRRTVHDFEVGAPMMAGAFDDLVGIAWSLYWDMALLATRLGDSARAERALALVPAGQVGANPLNDALTLARMGRLSDARNLQRKLAERSDAVDDVLTRATVRDLANRLDRAEELAAGAARAPTPQARTLGEAVRLAELGAYLAALRVLEAGTMLDAPEGAPFLAQLLVACRLDAAARVVISRRTGDEHASAALQALVAELPERLRAIPPVPGELQDVLTRAAAATSDGAVRPR